MRQGTGLVGADHLCAAQRLHRREPADHCTLTAHPGHPHRKHDGHHRGQPLRHRRYRQTYRHQKGVQNGGQIHAAVSPQAEPEQKHANGQHQRTQGPAQARQRLLQRCLALCGLRQRPGNAAHLGVHSGGGDQKLAPAIPHGAAQIGHAAALGQRSIRPRRAGVFFHRQALTGEGGFLGAQADAFHEPPVRRNRVPRLQQYHVPRHQLLAGHLQLTATPQHPAVGCCHLLQRLNGLLGLVLLIDPQHPVDDHHRQNDEHIRKALPCHSRRPARHRRRGQQHHDHRVGHLLQKSLEQPGLLLLGQSVGAVLGQTAGRLCFPEPLRAAFCPPQRGLNLQLIPFHSLVLLFPQPVPFSVCGKKAGHE